MSNPGARSWFRDSATEQLDLARRCTGLLDRYDVPWVELRTTRTGRRVYEDEVQVVAVPFGFSEHWPLRDRTAARPT